MNKQWRTIAVFLSLAMNAVAAARGADLKFHAAPGPEPVVGHYVVTLSDSVATDLLEASAEALAAAYAGQLEPYRSARARQFAITMLPPRAWSLSADPRVREVVEIAQLDDSEISPPLSTAPSGLARQHLVPAVRDTYSTGTYAYDGAGNITAIGADTYAYDTAQRLVRSVTRGVEEDYSYDTFGNRKSATGAVNCLGQTTCAQTVTVDSNTNHLTAINGAAVTYDDAGNVKSIAATSGSPGAVYSYDGSGMMTEATVGSDDRQFIYTADEERIAVRQGASWTWTVRDQGGKVLREFTSLDSGPPNYAMTNRQWAKDYVWRDGLLLATVTPAGTLHYHLDHLGTPRLVTDVNGVKVAEHAYYPFGAEINVTPHETPEEAMKFTGHERDIGAGDGHTLDYMHARFDNASLGRFLSIDPTLDVEKALYEPQMWNRYAYVTNNPLRYMDADGKERLQAYHFHRQPVPYQGFRQELITIAKPAAFIAALMFGPEIAATAVTTFLMNPAGVTNAIGNAFTPGPGGEMPGVSNPISGDFERVISTKAGDVSILANASTKGTVLTLSDISIYGTDKTIKAGEAGAGAFKAAVTGLAAEAKAQGYTQIILQGLRYSGATKDTDKAVRDILINLVEKAN